MKSGDFLSEHKENLTAYSAVGEEKEARMVELRQEWSEVVISIQRDVGRLMDEVVSRKPPSVRFSPRTWQPAIDVFETDTEIVVLADLAGVKEDEIELVVHHSMLTIRGERKDVKQGIKRTYSQMEILWGPFERNVALAANVNVEQIKAFYEAGILEVVMPKKDEKKARRVNIQTS
ncbi:MAG: Hsp20/alpha crystallin family protein [Dehalococcoidia bacterium]